MGDELRVPRLLTVRQVAELTGVACWRLYSEIAAGSGPPVLRLGRTIRIAEPALLKWIEERQQRESD